MRKHYVILQYSFYPHLTLERDWRYTHLAMQENMKYQATTEVASREAISENTLDKQYLIKICPSLAKISCHFINQSKIDQKLGIPLTVRFYWRLDFG